ncbi:MAG: hypothetical protein WCH43_02265 [Verrucomicrobiota bacterium]
MQEPGFFELVRQHLSQPEYLHVFLHPLPIYGLALGVLALIIAMALRSRPAQITALSLVFLCALSAWPVAHFGEEAFDRVESMSNADGNAWLDAHAQRATRALPVFYGLAALAALALLLPWPFPKSALPLNILTLLLALVTLGIGGWIALAGGQIRHSEFRYGKPPEPLGGYEKMRD